MTVDALRQYFRNLSGVLQNGKVGMEVINDLAAIDRGLTPFASLPLKEFAVFLEKAQDYDPKAVIGKKVAGTTTPRATKATVDIDGIAATIKHLYDNSTRPDVTIESINEALKVLDNLTGSNLKIVAKAIKADKGLSGKSVPEIREIVKDAVRGMWGSAQRVRQ